MTEAELKQHLEISERNPKHVAAAVLGVPYATLRWKPAPDKWCILEILAHLADIEIVYAYRLRQMLADTNPVIAPMDQNAWAQKLGYMQSTPAELVALYGLNRHANLQLLRRMKPEDLSKSAHHPETNREVSVAEIIERMSTHGTKHLQQIERLKTDRLKADSSKIEGMKASPTSRPN
jgi:DinB superfamily